MINIFSTIRPRTYLLLLIFIGFLLYAKGLSNGFVGDDDLQIIRNIKIHSVTNIPWIFTGSTYESGGSDSMTGIFYRPLMMTVFTLIYGFSGPTPFVFHLVQLLIHMANTVLVFLFLRYFFKDRGAFLLSLLFLVHPINSEAVLYIANLQEVLFFFFGMLALVLLQRKQSYTQVVLVPLLLLFSLFAKESGIVFLVLVPLYTYFFTKQKKLLKSFLISLPVVFVAYLIFRFGLAHMWYHNSSSLAPIANLPLSQRVFNIPAIISYYLYILVFPRNLNVYQFWTVTNFSLTGFWLPLFFLLAFFSLLYIVYRWLFRRYKKETKPFIFFTLWFFLGIALHLQIIPLDATVADRWFYFPFVGITVACALVIKLFLGKKLAISKLAPAFAVILFCLLAGRTFVRISDWKNNLSIYGHDLHYPSNFILENAYASALIQAGQFSNAKIHADISVKQHPYSANLNNLAIAYTGLNNKQQAKQYFRQALTKGDNVSVYENYASFLLYYDNPKEALAFSQQSLKTFPKSPTLWLVYGQALYIDKQQDPALKAVATSYKIDPTEKTAEIFSLIQQHKMLNLKI